MAIEYCKAYWLRPSLNQRSGNRHAGLIESRREWRSAPLSDHSCADSLATALSKSERDAAMDRITDPRPWRSAIQTGSLYVNQTFPSKSSQMSSFNGRSMPLQLVCLHERCAALWVAKHHQCRRPQGHVGLGGPSRVINLREYREASGLQGILQNRCRLDE
jgi:hypothetical protein